MGEFDSISSLRFSLNICVAIPTSLSSRLDFAQSSTRWRRKGWASSWRNHDRNYICYSREESRRFFFLIFARTREFSLIGLAACPDILHPVRYILNNVQPFFLPFSLSSFYLFIFLLSLCQGHRLVGEYIPWHPFLSTSVHVQLQMSNLCLFWRTIMEHDKVILPVKWLLTLILKKKEIPKSTTLFLL